MNTLAFTLSLQRRSSDLGQFTSSNTKLDPGSNFRVELNGSVAATGYDRLRVFGTLDLNGALLLPAKAAGYAPADGSVQDRKSTRLNSSHLGISYDVFCLK